MKAVVCNRYGSPDVLHLEEVEKPTPNDNEVLVKIHAATVNRTDTALIRAIPFFSRFFTGFFKPKESILGSEYAGEIEAIGKSVSSYKVGDKVFGFNETLFGSHAEYMTTSENNALTIIPKNITYDQAAASIEGAHYAYNFINKVTLKSGHRVLVNGGTGGIGSAAIQLLKHFDVDVTAVCGTENIELVKSLGAHRVIDYKKEDFTKEKQKYNFVFDTVGKNSFGKCKAVLEPDGIYISSELGAMSQNIFFALVTPIFGKKKVLFPLPVDCKGSIAFIKERIEGGDFKAVIDRRYPLEEIVEAYKYVEKGQKIGNVVITVSHN